VYQGKGRAFKKMTMTTALKKDSLLRVLLDQFIWL